LTASTHLPPLPSPRGPKIRVKAGEIELGGQHISTGANPSCIVGVDFLFPPPSARCVRIGGLARSFLTEFLGSVFLYLFFGLFSRLSKPFILFRFWLQIDRNRACYFDWFLQPPSPPSVSAFFVLPLLLLLISWGRGYSTFSRPFDWPFFWRRRWL